MEEKQPQTIIFWKTFNSISFVLSYLLMTLRGKTFVDSEDKGKVNLIGYVYHAKTWDKEKSELEHDFKGDCLKRVVIATCALSMGVRMVINSESCQRKELYGYFSDSDVSVEPGHNCCSSCRKDCKCGGEECEDQQQLLAADGETPSPPDQV